MFSFANNNCEEPSLKAESASLKSKVSCSGKMQLLHTTASFETVAYWAVQSFMLGRAVSITTDWLCKSLGRHHKKKAERGREGVKDSNKTSPISVCGNMKWGGVEATSGGKYDLSHVLSLQTSQRFQR